VPTPVWRNRGLVSNLFSAVIHYSLFGAMMKITNNNPDWLILTDNGHGSNTPGKCSPDVRFKEYKYTREITSAVV
jgi:hypothetical protein